MYAARILTSGFMKFTVLVGDVMTKNIKKIDINDTIEKAAQIMRDEKVGSVVVAGEKNIKGIVTTTDIVCKHVASKKGPQVKDIMSTNLISISPSATIEEAARLMVRNSVEKVLVFDRDSLVGIITNNDIIKVEPAIVEILLERMRMAGPRPPSDVAVSACEECGAYSDSIEEVNGVYLCAGCSGAEQEA